MVEGTNEGKGVGSVPNFGKRPWEIPAPENQPDPQNQPQDENDKNKRIQEQYVLVADQNMDVESDFEFDIMVRGFQQPQGKIHLNKGDVWKYGTTVNPEKRYTQKWLTEKKLKKVHQEWGTKEEVRKYEKTKIIKYTIQHGKLPPGNKQNS